MVRAPRSLQGSFPDITGDTTHCRWHKRTLFLVATCHPVFHVAMVDLHVAAASPRGTCARQLRHGVQAAETARSERDLQAQHTRTAQAAQRIHR